MKLPIIVVEDGDVSIFESVVDAESYLEPIDVRNDEYTAYDRDGYLLKLFITEEKKSSFFGGSNCIEVVSISAAREKSDRSNDLYEVLINFFKKTKLYIEKDKTLPLHDLIDIAVSRYGYTK